MPLRDELATNEEVEPAVEPIQIDRGEERRDDWESNEDDESEPNDGIGVENSEEEAVQASNKREITHLCNVQGIYTMGLNLLHFL